MQIDLILEKYLEEITEASAKKVNPKKYDTREEYWNAVLKVWGAKSFKSLSKEERKTFLEYIEKTWKDT